MVVRPGVAFVGLVLVAAWGTRLPAQSDDGERLRAELEDRHVEGADFWIYNDIDEARALAAREDKPIFVTFRCVPCTACAGFDAEVASGSERIEQLARNQFVSVRQVEMKGVDLEQFQFDYDLNWAAMFIHPDGTVYARYGTQSAEGPDAYNSIEGLERTMLRVLELHAAYPDNREELAGKRGPDLAYETALEMPGMDQRERFAGTTTRQNCIHCHNIHDAQNIDAQQRGELDLASLWRYPLPDNLGIKIEADHGRLIREILDDSPADASGLQEGEQLTHVDGQVITSVADIQWALHQLPNEATQVSVRGSRTGEAVLRLPTDWKQTDISWRGSIWSVQPRMRVWAPPATDEQREGLPVEDDQGAFVVRWINRGQPGGRAAFEAGLREGDIIVRLDGEPIMVHEPNRFQLHIKLNYDVGDRLPLTVLRNGRTREIEIDLVE